MSCPKCDVALEPQTFELNAWSTVTVRACPFCHYSPCQDALAESELGFGEQLNRRLAHLGLRQ